MFKRAIGAGAGALVLSLTTQAIIQRLGLKWAFFVNAFISLVVLIPVIFLLKSTWISTYVGFSHPHPASLSFFVIVYITICPIHIFYRQSSHNPGQIWTHPISTTLASRLHICLDLGILHQFRIHLGNLHDSDILDVRSWFLASPGLEPAGDLGYGTNRRPSSRWTADGSLWKD